MTIHVHYTDVVESGDNLRGYAEGVGVGHITLHGYSEAGGERSGLNLLDAIPGVVERKPDLWFECRIVPTPASLEQLPTFCIERIVL